MCAPLARPTKREHCTDQLCGCDWDEAVAEAVCSHNSCAFHWYLATSCCCAHHCNGCCCLLPSHFRFDAEAGRVLEELGRFAELKRSTAERFTAGLAAQLERLFAPPPQAAAAAAVAGCC